MATTSGPPTNLINTPRTPEAEFKSHFPPLANGLSPVSEVLEICKDCGQEIWVQRYVGFTSVICIKQTPCKCRGNSEGGADWERYSKHSRIDVTTELDVLFHNWNLLYTDGKEYHVGGVKADDEQQEKVKNSVVGYTRSFKPGAKGICFFGKSGRGKTHMAMVIAHAVASNGHTVLAIKSIDLLNRLRKCYQSRDSDEEIKVMRVLKNVDLLIIDDIGSEKVTGWVAEKLYEVIDTRSERFTTIFTTNFTGEEMEDKLGQALASRIFGTGYQVHVTGKDRRLSNAKLEFKDIGEGGDK